MTQSLIDIIGAERASELMNQAVKDAVAQALEQGVPITGMVNGQIVKIFPNGQIVPVAVLGDLKIG
jgi:hypothetical protein